MSRRTHAPVLTAVLALALLAPLAAEAQGRHIAILLDTSRSMEENDPRRDTAQIAKILSDMAQPADEVTVIRMPQEGLGGILSTLFSGCSPRADSSLARRHRGADTTGFKRRIDALVSYDTGTFFAVPIRTAIEALTLDGSRERMLLIVADSGGLDPCTAPLTRELSRLHDSGAVVAAVNLGGAGAFEGNPAFDFTIGARDSHDLVNAVAQVYQRFLGSKRVQTGRVDGLVEVTIDPHVSEAYLVVAADGPLGQLQEASGNPGAKLLDLDYRGGGSTTGLDRITRGYRIVRLEAPRPGRWTFRAPALGSSAGWLLIQDSAIGVRMITQEVPRGVATRIEMELYDEVTGKRLEDACDLPGMDLSTSVAGRRVELRDGGTDGDRQAGDCVFSAMATFPQDGRQDMAVHLETDRLDETFRLSTSVADQAWRIEPEIPERPESGTEVEVIAQLNEVVPGAAAEPPDAVVVTREGREVAVLKDDGEAADDTAGDGRYTGTFVAAEPSTSELTFEAVGGAPSVSARARLEVVGALRLADPPPIRFEPLTGGGEAPGLLDLSDAEVAGSYEVGITSDYRAGRTVLEIDTGGGWTPLAEVPVPVTLSRDGRRTFPLRLRAADCPDGVAQDEEFHVRIEGIGPGGLPVHASARLVATVTPDPWLQCWWPVLAAGAGLGLLAVVIHGFWSPSRFSRRLAVFLAPVEDMSEGYPHSVRRTRGSGSGFYRNATVYVCEDYRLAGRPAGSLACLRAEKSRVRIRPTDGATVWYQAVDGEWERLPPEDSAARFGSLYRNEQGNLYFELRNV